VRFIDAAFDTLVPEAKRAYTAEYLAEGNAGRLMEYKLSVLEENGIILGLTQRY